MMVGGFDPDILIFTGAIGKGMPYGRRVIHRVRKKIVVPSGF